MGSVEVHSLFVGDRGGCCRWRVLGRFNGVSLWSWLFTMRLKSLIMPGSHIIGVFAFWRRSHILVAFRWSLLFFCLELLFLLPDLVHLDKGKNAPG